MREHEINIREMGYRSGKRITVVLTKPVHARARHVIRSAGLFLAIQGKI